MTQSNAVTQINRLMNTYIIIPIIILIIVTFIPGRSSDSEDE